MGKTMIETTKLANEEVICTFMEPKPLNRPGRLDDNSLWWRWGWCRTESSLPRHQDPAEYCWLPRKLTLNECHEVEERLRLGTPSQRSMYHAYGRNIVFAQKWHADAPTRIAALAATVWPEVQAALRALGIEATRAHAVLRSEVER